MTGVAVTVIHIGEFCDRGPDASFVRRDSEGRNVYSFAIEYRMNNSTWAANIWAYSHEDAEARVKEMMETLTVCGQIYCEVPV